MKHRTAMIVAAAMTAFVLALAAGLTVTMASKGAVATQQGAVAETATSVPTRQPTSTGAPAPLKAEASVTTFLTSGQAKSAVLRFMPNARFQKEPELVNFRGKMAYEALLDVGGIYIDAFTGQVLYNGTAAAPDPTSPIVANGGGGGGQNVGSALPSSPPQSVSGSGGQEHHEGEHEGGEHEGGD